MATYYIDGEAATNGAGTYADPYNVTPTISSNNTYLYAAGHTLDGAGSTAIYITAGASGVQVGAYDPETGARLEAGSNKAIIYSESTWVVRVGTNAHNFMIEMLDVSGGGPGISTNAGIYIGNSDSLVANGGTVRRCRIHDMVGNNASTCTGLSFRGSDLSIYENEIFNINTDGIYGVGNSVRIYDNVIYNVDNAPSYGFGDCIQITGTATLGCSNAYIARNKVTNPKTNKQCIILQDVTRVSSGGVIEYNDCWMPFDLGISNVIFVEVTGITVRRNKLVGGAYGIFVGADNVIVESNLAIDNKTGIAQESSVAAGVQVLNNTVVNSYYRGIHTTDDQTAVIKNNLVVGCDVGIAKHGLATEDYNAYWQCATNQENNGGTPVWGTHNVTSDPLLTATYRPKSGSPILQAGTSISYASRDIEGRQRPNPPSIGAYDVATLRTVL